MEQWLGVILESLPVACVDHQLDAVQHCVVEHGPAIDPPGSSGPGPLWVTRWCCRRIVVSPLLVASGRLSVPFVSAPGDEYAPQATGRAGTWKRSGGTGSSCT